MKKNLQNYRSTPLDHPITSAFDKLESRAVNITALCDEAKSDSAKSGALENLLDQSAIEEELETIRDLNNSFSDGQIMNEFLDEKIKAVGVRIKQVSAQGHEVLKDLQESKSDDEIEKENRKNLRHSFPPAGIGKNKVDFDTKH